MDHTLAVKVSDHQSGELMVAFLKDHLKSWGRIIGDDRIREHSWTGPQWDAMRKNQMVFEYAGGGGGEREYLFAVVRWIAMRIGDRHKARILPQYLDGCTWV